MFQTAIEFWSQNVILANLSHAVGGFGLAIILQRYLRGNSFLPVVVGWIFLSFTLATHIYAYTR
jgi:hypothetical protein